MWWHVLSSSVYGREHPGGFCIILSFCWSSLSLFLCWRAGAWPRCLIHFEFLKITGESLLVPWQQTLLISSWFQDARGFFTVWKLFSAAVTIKVLLTILCDLLKLSRDKCTFSEIAFWTSGSVLSWKGLDLLQSDILLHITAQIVHLCFIFIHLLVSI